MTRRARLAAVVVVVAALVAGAFGVAALLDDDASPAERALIRALGSARPAAAPFDGLTEVRLGVGDRCFRVVVADSLEERVAGLRGRSDLGSYDGLLFVFPESTTTRFTMSGVPVGLDIGFYGPDGVPVSNGPMEPCAEAETRCPVYEAAGAYRYALETLRGGLAGGALSSCG